VTSIGNFSSLLTRIPVMHFLSPFLLFGMMISFVVSFSLQPSCFDFRDSLSSYHNDQRCASSVLLARLSDKRKKELGVADDEDEYDLSQALNANTDPLITKLIAGSLIVVVIGLLVVAVIIPLTSDTGDGLCNPILNSGRC
jgi:predicted RND superfamily exporter protein